MTNWPKISIVTPSFNQGKFLEKTILSVLEQDYPNLEYIIIDGGSTDNSVEIIKKYEQHLTYWVTEPDRGQSHAINKGFERATGVIFGWLNSDDWYHPGALKAVAEAFAGNPQAGAVVGAGNMVNEKGEIVYHNDAYEVTTEELYKWHNHFFWQPSCFFTKDAWENSGPLDDKIHYALDLDLWFKIAAKYKFSQIECMLSSSLKHEKAKTTAFDYDLAIDITFVVLKYGGGATARIGLERYLKGLHQLLEERWEGMQKMEVMINDRTAAIQKMEEMIDERGSTIQQMDEMIRQREEIIEMQNRLLEQPILIIIGRLKDKFSSLFK